MTAHKPKVEVSCEYCKKPFLVLASRVGVIFYCSVECRKIGSKIKRSLWGKTNRNSDKYRLAQSERTKKSWKDEDGRKHHLSAMQTQSYHEMRSANAKRIIASDKWKKAIYTYKNSGEAKKRCATRKMPLLPNWRSYIAADGKEYHFRSAWEEATARYLDMLKLYWEFEPQRFILDDGSSYTPDFLVQSPFGLCYLECHRLGDIKPGDEEKVSRLFRISKENLLGVPLILFDKPEITKIFKLVGMRYKKKK